MRETWRPAVFVSSTYSDLIEERAEVLSAIQIKGLAAVAMEYWGASSQSPLEGSIEGAQAGAIFVAIVGWTVGSLPPNSKERYTEAEFTEAEKRKVPRLIYLLDDTRKPTEVSLEVKRFRDRAKASGVTVRDFSKLTTLVAHVVEDLGTEIARLRAQRIAARDRGQPLLPYLCDRTPQIRALRTHLNEPREHVPVCLLHGMRREESDRFVECLELKYLGELLRFRLLGKSTPATIAELPSDWPGFKRLALGWPDLPPEKVVATLRAELAERVGLDPSVATDPLIRERVASGRQPLCITIAAPSEPATSEYLQRLSAIVSYFSDWPLARDKGWQVELVVIYWLHPELKASTGLKARLFGDKECEAQKALRVAIDGFKGGQAVALPELRSIDQLAVNEWRSLPEVSKATGNYSFDQSVTELFSNGRKVPMAELIPVLTRWLVVHQELVSPSSE